MVFLKVMDLSDMKVQASVNQAESPLLRSGQEVRIGLDAFPDLKFSGTIVSVGALASGSSNRNDYVRTVPVTIHIDGTNPRLIPDLTAYADVILERQEGVIRLPLQAVSEESGQAYVYVKNGDEFDKRPVVLGERSFTHVAVTDGLRSGEEVALQIPEAAPES
jgi:multidrug efflux pump subunit AcrA (membrane-fusion protein)